MVISKRAQSLISNFFYRENLSYERKRPFPEDGSEASQEATRRKTPPKNTEDAQRVEDKADLSQRPFQASKKHGVKEESDFSSQPLRSSQHSLPTRTLNLQSPANEADDPGPTPSAGKSVAESQPSLPTPTSSTIHPNNIVTLTPIATSDLGDLKSTNAGIASSQPAFTSSQRIMKKGEIMITNSDDESDMDEQSDSDDSLLDFDQLLKGQRLSLVSPPQPDPQLPYPEDEGVRKSNRKTKGKARTTKAPSNPQHTPPVMPKYSFSLDTLAKRRKQEEASKAAIGRAKSMMESLDQQMASANQKNKTFDAGMIDSVLKEHGDEDDIGRLKSAIQRTEAFEHGKSWSFFEDHTEDPALDLADFPSVEDKRLRRLFGQEVPRQQAFLSGYAGEHAAEKGLPEEIMIWMMDAICLETRDDLRYSYTLTLKDSAEHLTPLLSPERIDLLFRKVGATATAVHVETPIVPRLFLSQKTEEKTRPGLLSVMSLLGSSAAHMAAESRLHLLNTLCRLILDHAVAKDCHAISAIQETFANSVEYIADADVDLELQSMMTTTYHTINDATLRLQLLQTLPAWSSRLTLLRQRLALAFFYQNTSYLSKQPPELVNLKSISRRLQSPQFNIRNTTDFSELAASIEILSIGIDDGNPPNTSVPEEEEKAFNKEVDSLASKINTMFNDIVDTGASHMKRTESKETLEGLQRRLEYVVRTKSKPKKSLFGDAEVDPFQKRMDAWIESGMQSNLLSLSKGKEMVTDGD